MSVPFSESTLPLPVSQALPGPLLSSLVLPVELGGKPHSEQLTQDGDKRGLWVGSCRGLGLSVISLPPPTQLEPVRFQHS